MSDVIKQEFQFTAGQAISSLTTLDRSVQQVAASINTLRASAAGKIGTPFDSIVVNARAATVATGELKGSLASLGSAGAASVNQVTVSWETMARVVQTQIIVRALSSVVTAFFEASEAAAAFQLQAARITAISDFDVSGAQEAIRELASISGRAVAESGEALFEALQNDLGSAEQTLDLLKGQANELALLTGGTLPQAVNALSSVIKSYNVDLAGAADITPTLFGAIDAGRITLADLENSLGTILPLSRQVDVSVREVAAGIATITRGGTDAATATTQLRNVFNKAIKPTKQLEEVYRSLGVSGFKELVAQAGGFIPALQAITDNLGNNETAIAKAFNTIRGSLGVFNVLRDGGQDYATVLEVIDNKAQDVASAIKNIESTDARRLERGMAELDIIMTDLGETTLKLKANFVDALTSIITSSDDVKSGVAGMAGGMAAATVASYGLRNSLVAVQTVLSRMGPLLAVTASVAAGLFINNKLNEYNASLLGIQDSFTQLDVIGKKFAQEEIFREERERADELADGIDGVGNRLNTLTQSARQAAGEMVHAFNSAAAGIQSAFQSAVGSATGFIDSSLKDIKKDLEGLDSTLNNLRAGEQKDQQALEDFRFDRRVEGMGSVLEAQERLNRATATNRELVQENERVRQGTGDREAAVRLGALAKSQGDAALAAAKATGDNRKLSEAYANQEAVLKNITIGNENFRSSLEGIDRGATDSAILDLSGQLTQVNDKAELASDLLNQIKEAEAAGGQKSFIEDLQKQYGELVKEIQARSKDILGSEIFDQAGLRDAADSAAETLERRLAQVSVDWSTAVSDLKSQLESADITVGVKIVLDELAGAQNPQLRDALAKAETANPVKTVQQQVLATQALNKQQGDLAANVRASGVAMKQAMTEFDAFAKQAAAGPRGFGQVFSSAGGRQDQMQMAAAILNPIKEGLATVSTATQEELQTFRANLTQSTQEVAAGEFSSTMQSDLNNAISQANTILTERLKNIGLEGLIDEEAFAESTQLLESLSEERTINIDFSMLQETSNKAEQTTQSMGQIDGQTRNATGSMNSLLGATNGLAGAASAAVGAFNAMAAAARAAAAAARDAASAAASAGGGGGGPSARNGGNVTYLAGGGAARGQDSIAAMLAPGEFVMNARSSRNFFSELQSMNSGRGGSGGSGGSVTNISVGDVRVMSNTQIPGQAARDIGLSIKREIRRRNLEL